ncbi:uncharacterized protein LOC132697203 [Cylas formicarius]|uniref:uncharacterized protein LOC132697203 n=1 Tax=Cylas formicarius TaxID=197179 RepID=UPI00295899C1|nr:uncharacterized protein LOC132697203 [Cylas formicarius]
MWNWYCLFILLIYIASCKISSTNGYDTPGGPQYHIQTDEGPERYFRYQTLSGQYRKEKRLHDGTVIGTYAWIDDDGIFRQRDYVADTGGYRIVKTKNILVGRDMPIADALKTAKKFPSSVDVLQSAKSGPVSVRPQPPPFIATTPVPSSSFSPIVEISNNALPSSTTLPLEVTSTAGSFVSSTERPFVEITPNSIDSTPKPFVITPADTRLTDFLVPSSTPKPLVITPAHTQLAGDVKYIQPLPNYETVPMYTEPNQKLDFNPYVSPVNKGYLFHNGPTYPIDRNGRTYRGSRYVSASPRIGDDYDKRHSGYDGVSVTNDGFRYYIPRAYHEEATLPGNERTGSFGYIDPFGIRRVIYYNTKPGSGFQHRKNNRYVGFDATPYDPRPY